MLGQKKFGVKKNVWAKQILGPKIWAEDFGRKICWIKKNFLVRKFFGCINFLVQKVWDQTTFGSSKFWVKNIWSKHNFWGQKVLVQKFFGEKILGPEKVLGQTKFGTKKLGVQIDLGSKNVIFKFGQNPPSNSWDIPLYRNWDKCCRDKCCLAKCPKCQIIHMADFWPVTLKIFVLINYRAPNKNPQTRLITMRSKPDYVEFVLL